MRLVASLLACVLVGAASAARQETSTDRPLVSWGAPSVYVEGLPYFVSVEITATGGAVDVPRWHFSPAVFEVGGEPLVPAEEAPPIHVAADSSWQVRFDLAPYLPARSEIVLGCRAGGAPPSTVTGLCIADPALDFMALPVDELAGWSALLVTNRGTMLLDLWPDVAPEHVRNLLDLCQTGFYDGILFHRVVPGFVIQAGCPHTKDPLYEMSSWGQGSGPRILDAEFSDRKHERGVLSMARGGDPHSASSQFFICQDERTDLDGKYTVFGKLRLGFETLDRIAFAPTYQRTTTPIEPQRIERALSVRPLGPDGDDRKE